MTGADNKIVVTKLDAARRQLRTAIHLWFNDGDPVSIHALAFAAYEIIHVVSKKRDRNRRDLVFDSLRIEDEYRSGWNKKIKEHANFFKHAKNDADASIEFVPELSILFLMAASAGVKLTGETPNAEESAFAFWLYYHRPGWLTPPLRKLFEDNIPIEHLTEIRKVPKPEFLKAIIMAFKNSPTLRG